MSVNQIFATDKTKSLPRTHMSVYGHIDDPCSEVSETWQQSFNTWYSQTLYQPKVLFDKGFTLSTLCLQIYANSEFQKKRWDTGRKS